MQGVKTVAICLAGEARTLRTDASIRRLLQQNFLAEASYSLFLSLEDATTAKDVAALLQNSSGGGGMTATDSHRQMACLAIAARRPQQPRRVCMSSMGLMSRCGRGD